MSRLSRILGLDYRNERTILSGGNIRVRTTRPSILFFSVHKAASSFAAGCIRRLCGAAGFKPVDLENYSFQHHRARPDLDRRYIQLQGIFYGPFRQYFDTGDSASLKIIVQVRDPRDAIVSSYFSYRDSHRAPVNDERRSAFEANRARLQLTSLDDYARNPDSPIISTLNNYASNFFSNEDVLVLHYEDMVADFDSWLDKIIDYAGIERGRKLNHARDRVIQKADFSRPVDENPGHRRQVFPGEHLARLEPDTTEALNRMCEDYFKTMRAFDRQPLLYSLPRTSPQAGTRRTA